MSGQGDRISGDGDQAVFRGYSLRRETWRIAGHSFVLEWPDDIDAILDLPITAERFARDEYLPYWAQPWPSSVLLAEEILRSEPGDGRSAVELGCGLGLVSLAAAARGWSVTAGDYDADALAFAERNAALNGLQLRQTLRIDYREPAPPAAYDAVFAADLLYERRKAGPVAGWIAAALRPDGLALVADPNRSAADGFPEAAAACGLHVSVRTVQTVTPAGLVARGRIWSVRHAGQGGVNTA